MSTIRAAASAALVLLSLGAESRAAAQRVTAPVAGRSVFLDSAAVIRWRDDSTEVALFGANYILPSASDYRAAGYLHLDRKRMIDDDMAHFARMGWNALRLTLWGDWENSDRAGNLIANDHLDLFDYLIARARERGIYMLLSPIQTYNANWPDALSDTTPPGFSNHYDRGQLGTNPAAIAAQANYLRQLLEHVNPYTGVAIKDEPAILFVELVNEPWHHPEDSAASVRYINTLADAVRGTGCTKLLFYNVSQDFRIAKAIRASHVQGTTFGWYPTGLNSGHELEGNYLRSVDAYPPMLAQPIASMPRIVYEFDSADLRTGYMYPAMARTFRAVGAQFATMFAYDMLGTASRNLGWQTHYLNLVYTPRKAMSAVIAAEAMRRLPRSESYGAYPANTRFADFHVDYATNLGELVADDAFLYTGSTSSTPPHPEHLRRVAGVGSSSVVDYAGQGIYFLDEIRHGVWRLEVYPDAIPIRDPYEPPNPTKIVTRAIWRSHPMRIRLPDLGTTFTRRGLAGGDLGVQQATVGQVTVSPGVYLLSNGRVDPRTLPKWIGALRFDEFHPPPRDTVGVQVLNETAATQSSGHGVTVTARVVDTVAPTSVTLAIRPVAGGFFRAHAMHSTNGYDYRADIPAESLPPAPYDYAVIVARGDSATTFPGAIPGRPWDWNFYGSTFYPLTIVPAAADVPLFDPRTDASRLAFTRIGDAGRRGIFRVSTATASGAAVFHLELPVFDHRGLDDYTASLVLDDRLAGRRADLHGGKAVKIRLRGIGAAQTLHITLVEHDGTGWSSAVSVDSAWREVTIPLTQLAIARSVNLPQGFPGDWNYWVAPAAGRGGAGDKLRLDDVERLQLSLRNEAGRRLEPGSYGVEIESITLMMR